MRAILFLYAFALILPVLCAEENVEIRVKVQGVLHKDEQTNDLSIVQEGWTFRLDFGKEPETRQAALQYLKQPVFVVGILTVPHDTPTIRVDFIGIRAIEAKADEEATPLPTAHRREILSF